MFQGQRLETVIPLKNRDDFDVGDESVHVCIGYLSGCFIAVDGEVVNFNSKTKWDDIELTEFYPAARDVLECRNQATIDHSLESIAAHVQKQRKHSNQTSGEQSQKNLSE